VSVNYVTLKLHKQTKHVLEQPTDHWTNPGLHIQCFILGGSTIRCSTNKRPAVNDCGTRYAHDDADFKSLIQMVAFLFRSISVSGNLGEIFPVLKKLLLDCVGTPTS
jgi:hypothetical protein